MASDDEHANLRFQEYIVHHLSDDEISEARRGASLYHSPRYSSVSQHFLRTISSATSNTPVYSGAFPDPEKDDKYFDSKSADYENAVDDDFLTLLKQGNSGQWPSPPQKVKGLRLPGFSAFEPADPLQLLLFTISCLAAYPLLYAVSVIASNRSLFWARFFVGAGCGLVGFTLGFFITEMAKFHLEASTWATIIHESSNADHLEGIHLRELVKRTTERTSYSAVFRLLLARMALRRNGKKKHRDYDSRHWSLVLLFLLFLAVTHASLSFIFGRIVKIDTHTAHQLETFQEVPVISDLSDQDVTRAQSLTPVFQGFAQTWTLAPFSELTNYPSSVTLTYNNETIYFAETYASQLQSGGVGFGTFQLNSSVPDARAVSSLGHASNSGTELPPGSLVQFPKWGLRLACALLPDIESYLVPMSEDGFSYVFVPDFFVKGLFENASIPYPNYKPANLSGLLSANDSLPAETDPNTIVAAYKFYNNGVAHSFASSPAYNGSTGGGWTELEVVLVRLNTTYTPQGSFPLFGAPLPDANGNPTMVGYDAAVCVETYESYIVESYNSSNLLPVTTRIVSKGSSIPDENSIPHLGKRDSRLNDVDRSLNSSGKFSAFAVAHDNSINQMVKDNGRDVWWVPSPLIVSFTGGSGPSGYTKLDPNTFATVRGMADATNVLPYLAGSKTLVGRQYNDVVLATAHVDGIALATTLVVVLLTGYVAGLCVPRLPLGVPRRGFDLYTWFAVLIGDKLIGQIPVATSEGGVGARMSINEVDRVLGDVNVVYLKQQ